MCYKIFTPLGYGVLLAKKQRLGPKLERAGLGQHPKIWDLLCSSATVEASKFKFGTQLGLGLAYQKTTFRTKIGGGLGYREHPKKIGTPYVFLQPLELATSYLVAQIGFGTSLPKNDV